ncbi:MAG: hypothetical protein R3E39_27910 [Anaerolineae bacterium]
MNVVDEVKRIMGLTPPPRYPNRPETSSLRETVDIGQRLKRSEQYGDALKAFESAMQQAISVGDSNAMAVIALHQAEVHMAQEHFDEAEAILKRSYQTAQESRQRSHMAYMLVGMGRLAQCCGEWKSAQTHYEQARETARQARSAGAEGRALGYLADVFRHDDNATYAVHLLREALPKLNMTGDVEPSSYFVGRLGEALIASGQPGEGRQLLERALRLAKQIGYRQYERRWGVTLGEQVASEGRLEEALGYFRDAMELIDPETHAEDYVRAMCQLSKICVDLRRLDEAGNYAKIASRTAAGRVGDKKLAAQTDMTMGIVLVAAKEYQAAISYLDAGVEAMGNLGVKPISFADTDVVRALAAAHAELGNEGAATETYRRAIVRAEKAEAKLEAAQAQRDLGLFFASRRKMAEAIQEWSAALAIYQSEQQTAQAARLYCDLASARKFIGHGQRAMKDYDDALMLLSNLKDDWETRGLVLSNAATAYADKGDVDSADSFFNESIAIARRLNNETAESTRRGNYGYFLLMTGRPQQAQSTLEFALRLSQKLELGLQTAIQTDNLGLLRDQQANYAEGLQLHREALAHITPLKNLHWEHTIRLNLANNLLASNELDEAGRLIETALTQGRTDEDTEVIIRALTAKAQWQMQLQQDQAMGEWLEEAVTRARKADMRRWQAEALEAYSQYQAVMGRREEAASLWRDAQKLYAILRAPQADIQPAWLNGSTQTN